MCGNAARLSFICPRRTAGHAPAFVRATEADLRARLAMLHLEFCAFIAASFTQLCASLANRTGKFAAACHIAGRHAAYLGAVHIQGNAACHRLRIGFLQAGCCAMVAGICARVAGFDTGCKLFMGHDYSNQELMRNSLTSAADRVVAGPAIQVWLSSIDITFCIASVPLTECELANLLMFPECAEALCAVKPMLLLVGGGLTFPRGESI